MTDAEFVASVLADGKPHSQDEILRRSFGDRGCGLTVHSRVADLRKRGYTITCERQRHGRRGAQYLYTLTESPLKKSDGADIRGAFLPDVHGESLRATAGPSSDSLSGAVSPAATGPTLPRTSAAPLPFQQLSLVVA